MVLTEQSVSVNKLAIGDVISFDWQTAKIAPFPGREARVIGMGEYTKHTPEQVVFVCLGLMFEKTFNGQPIVDQYGNPIQIEVFITMRTGSRVKRKLREEVSRG